MDGMAKSLTHKANENATQCQVESSPTCAVTVRPKVVKLYPPSRHDTIRPSHTSSAHCLTAAVIETKSSSSSRSCPKGSVRCASNPADIKIRSGLTMAEISSNAASNDRFCSFAGVLALTGTFNVLL